LQPIFFGLNLMVGGILVMAGLKLNPETGNNDLRSATV